VLGEAPVSAEPEDRGTAAPAGHLRAARTDREQVVDVLKAAFVQGRMPKDEFDARVDRTFASRTYAELAAITADIPAGILAGQTRDQPPRPAARGQAWTPALAAARRPVSHTTKARRFMVIGVVLLLMFTAARGAPSLLFAPLCLAAWVLAGAQLIAARRERRGIGPLPGPPAAQRPAPEAGQPAGDG
jgi:Domain of unknown function (DUF1707)